MFIPSLCLPRRTALLALLLAAAVVPAKSLALPVVGFREEFPGISTSTWQGGVPLENPGTGGVGGNGDGYLSVQSTSLIFLGTVSAGSEYAGDWQLAGVTQIRAWLRDTGGTGDLLIHASVGNPGNLWQHDAGLAPPSDRWAEYVVDLTQPSDFTQIRGSGTFANALQNGDRLLLRHDLPPYESFPDQVIGGFGLDHILLTNGVTGVASPAAIGRPVLLERPWPNPARGPVSFAIQSPQGAAVDLTVLDVSGRRVRQARLAAGSAARMWMWDGRDDAGVALPAGAYQVLARGPGGGSSRTVTLLR